MKFKPMVNKIIVKQSEAKDVTDGGIVIPEGAKEKPKSGEVVATNGSTTHLDAWAVVGDTILFPSYAGTEIVVEGETYLVMSFDDILAVECKEEETK